MKLDSKYFDSIRIRPEPMVARDARPRCDHLGCGRKGEFRAPKGRLHEGGYFTFCLDHVRDYNKAYNYFAGMADRDIDAYRVDAATGHRPTWAMGAGAGRPAETGEPAPAAGSAGPPRDVFGIFGGIGTQKQAPEPPRARPLHNAERRSFAVLDLEGGEGRVEIKARFKALVKRLHPDANGGDRSSEDKLREILQAYNHLKATGYC